MTADPLRDQIARVIYETRYGEPWFEALDGAGRAGAMREADAILPILRAAEEQARADTAETIAQAIEWEPTRWWRAVGPDEQVWCESSDEAEVREMARPRDRLAQLWRTVVSYEWRSQP